MRHPMPCPGCRKIIDATERLCPHCGIDTDAKLAPMRMALPLVLVGVVVFVGALAQGNGVRALAAMGAGLLLAVAVVVWKRRQ